MATDIVTKTLAAIIGRKRHLTQSLKSRRPSSSHEW